MSAQKQFKETRHVAGLIKFQKHRAEMVHITKTSIRNRETYASYAYVTYLMPMHLE